MLLLVLSLTTLWMNFLMEIKFFWNINFFIINEHFFTIEIYAAEISPDTEKIAQELIEKLVNCCNILDIVLQNHFKEEIKSKRYYVNNIYWNVKRIYEFFRDTLKEEKKYESIIEVVYEFWEIYWHSKYKTRQRDAFKRDAFDARGGIVLIKLNDQMDKKLWAREIEKQFKEQTAISIQEMIPQKSLKEWLGDNENE